MPASVLYAKTVGHKIDERPDRSCAALPIAEGFALGDEGRAGRIEGVSLDYDSETLRAITAIGAARKTVTGVAEKHKSQLPYAVTAPGIRLWGTLRET